MSTLLAVCAVLTALPGAVYSTMQLCDRLRKRK